TLSHYEVHSRADDGTQAANEGGLLNTTFHWGFHPWASYAVVALALAYFKFRHNALALISSTFAPLLGDRVKGRIGIGIDTLAVFATVFGIATSLGLRAKLITSGLSFTFEVFSDTLMTNLLVILVVTILFIFSTTTGVDRGIRYLSWFNVVLAIALMLF